MAFSYRLLTRPKRLRVKAVLFLQLLEPQDATDSLGSRCRAIAQAVVRAGNHYEWTAQKLSRHPRARLAGCTDRKLAQKHSRHRL